MRIVIALLLCAFALDSMAGLEAGVEAYNNGQFESAAKAFGEAEALTSEAAYMLGTMYEDGRGVAKDDRVAAEWYRKSAEHVLLPREDRYYSVISWHNLGVLYEEGRGVGKSVLTAVECYKKAAELGYTPSQFNLGLLLAQGNGELERNLVEAYKWLTLAAEGADNKAKAVLALVEKEMTVAEMTQAKAEMVDFKMKKAK